MTDLSRGLTLKEVEQRVKAGLSNVSVKKQSKSVPQIIASNVFTYFNLIFAVFALLLILVRSYINMTFLPIIIINILIGIVQEIRSKRVLDKLKVLNAPKTKVIRDGQMTEINSESLVKGDLCVFEAGNQICADAKIVEGKVRVNEALITGEADEITKDCGGDLLSGSFVVSGRCKAVLDKVGEASYVSKLTLEAKASAKKKQTEMMKSLDKMVRAIGVLIIPIGIIMYIQDRFFLGFTIQSSVVAIIAALVGMIPEGLYLLASVALVVSVMRLGKKHVLVHEMACVETLARVDVLCVDKTGTITENKMSVQEVIPIKPNNEFEVEPLYELISKLVNNMDADNTTIQALQEYFNDTDVIKANKICPFSSEIKYSGAEFDDGAYVIGAPEKLLLNEYKNYADEISEMTEKGCRVLVFGTYEGSLDGKPLLMPINPLAFISLNNRIRPEAKDTFNYFEKQGVCIKVISGDNPVTASTVAKKAGIAHANNYVDATTLNTYEDYSEAVSKYTVFGRVSPEQKKHLVNALKEAGHVVAMTGDGVNDILALKSADCSVAMASGSDAASSVAQVVLLDSDFSCMPSVVLEGRRVVNNIQRAASLFLVKNIFSMLMALFALMAANKYPLFPTQLSLLGAFTIGTPAFFLALQPNKSIISGHFLTNVSIKALPAAITDFFVVAFITAFGNITGIPHEQVSTMAIMVLLTVGITTLLRVCRPFDVIRIFVCASMIVGIVTGIVFFKDLFAIYPLSGTQWMITWILMGISIPLFILMCKIVGAITRGLAKHNKSFRNRISK